MPILGKAGFRISPERLLDAHEEVWERCSRIWATDRDISNEEQTLLWLRLADGRDWAVLGKSGLRRIARIYGEAVYRHPPRLREGARETLRELKRRGLKVGLICNTGRTPGYCLRRVLRREGLLRFFDVLSFSDELRIRKPDPEIFRRTLRAMRVRPAEALHVGDRLDTDVAGAKQAGLGAVLIGLGAGRSPRHPPDARIRRLPELLRLIERL